MMRELDEMDGVMMREGEIGKVMEMDVVTRSKCKVQGAICDE